MPTLARCSGRSSKNNPHLAAGCLLVLPQGSFGTHGQYCDMPIQFALDSFELRKPFRHYLRTVLKHSRVYCCIGDSVFGVFGSRFAWRLSCSRDPRDGKGHWLFLNPIPLTHHAFFFLARMTSYLCDRFCLPVPLSSKRKERAFLLIGLIVSRWSRHVALVLV